MTTIPCAVCGEPMSAPATIYPTIYYRCGACSADTTRLESAMGGVGVESEGDALRADRDALAVALRAMVALGEWDKGSAHISVAYVARQEAAFALARAALARLAIPK